MLINQSSETIELLEHSEILLPQVNQDQSEIDDWDDESSTTATDSDNSLIPENSVLMKLGLPLTEDEKNLIDEFYQDMQGVNKENYQEYIEPSDLNINCTRNALERVEHLIDEYLEKGIKLNSLCNNHEYTVSNLVFKEIINIVDRVIHITPTTISRIDPLTGEDALDELTETESAEFLISIVRKLLLAGAKIHPDFYYYRRIDEVMYGSDESIFLEYEKVKNGLRDAAFEGIINKNTQVKKDDLVVEIDNHSFYVKYPQDNGAVEVAKVINNLKVKDLNLRCHTFHIGESVVKVESIGQKRNYVDVLNSGIVLSFESVIGKISIHLYPDAADNNKIKVELDEVSEDKIRKNIDKLKNKNTMGENFLLGGKSVMQAILDGNFERNVNVSKESSEQITVVNKQSPSTCMKEISMNNIQEHVEYVR